ncbi:SDR family oxidoreductase [Nocardia terpenica]|uniref:SDR family oxidoreductase n=1 Tax=Nocardia terpenica TaxID=455432 RepID=UPI001896054B|nr:SDR family oxidoreductase [Nocardia terpenica]MBF6059937.1 SDR family oxidoreductase [Nocardia terpenica]MBF6102522.1 SDR family oxidoreductase [Nocardia terpenica]MBF6111287.1 SDR family oxidoreductase [Nocardia terpenica]MBF6117418.1 SDR family oxidoreductase [Nocardia terpenica]MBF6150741.1 SDR family oxidoreductase [Nocardia terpenica]
MTARDRTGKVVVVTGAATGLGRDCVLDLEDRGFRVVAGVRRTEDGEKLVAAARHGRLRYALVDVTDDDSIRACAEFVDSEYGELWGLVNNAGICIAGPLECIGTPQLRRQLDTNLVGQLSMIRAHLPLLRRSRGRIVNITSGLGTVAFPHFGAYAAAQFAKEALSDALRRELAPSGVEVSVVAPGAIFTPIWDKVPRTAGQVLDEAPAEVARIYRAGFEATMSASVQQARDSHTTGEQVAAVVARALTATRPRTRYRVGPDSRRVAVLARLLPDRLLDRYLRGGADAR